MLFYTQVPQLFEKLNLAAFNASTQARKLETAKRLNLYHDAQLERLEEQLSQLFSDPDSMVKVCLNVVKKVVNNLAQVYREPPVRTLEATEAEKDRYAAILEKTAFDAKLKQASRYTKLLKTILLRPVWRNEKIDLDILTGNLVDVENGDSPEILLKALVTNYGTSERIEDVTYSLWTPEIWSRLDYLGNVIKRQENPYGLLPFIPVFDYPPPSSAFWLPGGNDLVSLQEAINIKLTDLVYLIQQQSFGVGYIKGSQGGSSLKVDPGSLVELPADKDASIGFVSQQAKISEVVDAIDRLIKWSCVSNGLSAASMSTNASEASGLSKLADRSELNEIRQDDVSLWRSYEHQLFVLMRTVWNTHNPKEQISDSAKLRIDFADPQQKLDAKSQAAADDLKLAQGVLSPVDILLRDNPDFAGDREKALAQLLTIREEIRSLEN